MRRKNEITKYKFSIALFFALIFFTTTACAATFKGKVIDADTKEPIEGAVVVASWLEETTTVGATHTELKDVRETLTDKNGEWVIKGPTGRDMGNITAIFTLLTGAYITNPPQFIVFKPGYCSWPEGFSIEACQKKIKPGGNDKVARGDMVDLPKLTARTDRLKAQEISIPLVEGDEVTLKKIKNFIRLKNEERKHLGLGEVDF